MGSELCSGQHRASTFAAAGAAGTPAVSARAGARGAAPASALRQAAAALELVCALPSDSGKPGRAAAARARAARIIYHYMKGLFGGCRDLLRSHGKGAERRHQDPPRAGVCRGTHGVWEGRPAAARPGDPRTLEGEGRGQQEQQNL